MTVKEIINNNFIPSKLSSKIADAKALLSSYAFNHLPVIDDQNHWVGNVARELIENTDKQTFLEISDALEYFTIHEHDIIFQAAAIFRKNGTNFLPVVDENNYYKGYITSEEVLNEWTQSPMVAEPGIVMIVEISQKQYTMTEVVKIVESNEAKLYGAEIYRFAGDEVQILIKMNQSNQDSVAETFERFGYKIIFKSESINRDQFLKDRYQQLMRFLET